MHTYILYNSLLLSISIVGPKQMWNKTTIRLKFYFEFYKHADLDRLLS